MSLGCFGFWKVKEKELWRQVLGLAQDELLLPIAPLVTSHFKNVYFSSLLSPFRPEMQKRPCKYQLDFLCKFYVTTITTELFLYLVFLVYELFGICFFLYIF